MNKYKLPSKSDHLPPDVRQQDIDGEDEYEDEMEDEEYWRHAERMSDRADTYEQ
jgi:hypothetical protein